MESSVLRRIIDQAKPDSLRHRRKIDMEFNYNDGGRSEYFKAKDVGDCVTRAIAIAMGKDYKEVYDELNRMTKAERSRRNRLGSSRDGICKGVWKKYLKNAGWIYVPTCEFGSHEKRMRLVDGAFPKKGRFIVQLSKHLTALIDGVINDTYDCSKQQYVDRTTGNTVTNDERCVYGYWKEPAEDKRKDAEGKD